MARPRSKKGEAIRPERRTADALAELEEMIAKAKAGGDLLTWRRGVAVRRYVDGRRVVDIAQELEVVRGSVNQWLRWYDTLGVEGLLPRKAPGAPPKLSPEQMEELGHLVDEGPIAAGFSSGMWTGPMVGELIQQRFGVTYHNHHVPRLLHRLGFSVQRPRKRLARADHEAQEYWIKTRLPAIKKKPPLVEE